MCRAMLSKSLIQFSVDERGCIPSLLFDQRPKYGGGNEDSGESESEVAQSIQLLATPWTAAHQAPPSMGFSR